MTLPDGNTGNEQDHVVELGYSYEIAPSDVTERYAAALGGVGTSASGEEAPGQQSAPGEVPLGVQDVVVMAEQKYRHNARPALEELGGKPQRLAEDLSVVGTRLDRVKEELPRARAALSVVAQYLVAPDLTLPAPGEVEQAVRQLFDVGGAYEDAWRKLPDDYGDRIAGVRNVQHGLTSIVQDAEAAQSAIEHEGLRHAKDSPSGMYTADHKAMVEGGLTTARLGAALAQEADKVLNGSPTLKAIPHGEDANRAVQILLHRVLAVGYEHVGLQRLRQDFTEVVERITAIDSGSSMIRAEVEGIRADLQALAGVIDDLKRSPLLSE